MFKDGTRIRTAARPAIKRLTPERVGPRHPFEKWLSNTLVRRILLWLTSGPNGYTPFENICYAYHNPDVPWVTRVRYWPVHRAIDFFVRKTHTPYEAAAGRVFHHEVKVRSLVNTARSIGANGLNAPLRFVAPLLVVWNITNRCNLACRHCYQNASRDRQPDELNRADKLNVIDQLSENCVAVVSIAGGEPLIDPNIWAVLERARQKHIHVTIATDGTPLTVANVRRLASLGVKYVEVSLDSVEPAVHDHFRGTQGAWERAVRGIRNVVETPGIRAGVACCFTRETVTHAQEMIDFAVSLGASTFVHFNFIPVGRGVEMAEEDMTPEQREDLLRLLQRTLDEKKIGVLSTAPQFGRACLMYGGSDGMAAIGHGGSGGGNEARVVAKYVGGCGAARCYCCIEPNGTVTPCVYIPSVILGSLRRSSFA